MSIMGFIRRRCFYLKDILTNKGEIYFQMKEIRERISDKDISFAEQKYNEIKEYAIKNVPFYKDYKATDNFPVMQKSDYISNYKQFESNDYPMPCHISSTSGSTGTPFSVKQDRIKRNRNLADLKVFGELCGYPSHEKMLFFRKYNKKRSKMKEWLENIYYITFSLTDDVEIRGMIEKIIKLKPYIVFSYPSILSSIVTYLEKNSEIDVKKANVKCFLMAGSSIDKTTVELIKKHFNCSTYRRYSNMELGIMGQDNGEYDNYKLNWGSYYFECLKVDSDEPTDEGETGRIVVTDLFNKAMPMIRYDTGDLGVMDRNHFGQPVITQISGRKNDILYNSNGERLDPVNVSVGLWGIKNILQWQFIQHDANNYEIKILPKGDYNPNETINKLKSILGDNANIKVTIVDGIPVMSSGKRRAIICNYKKEE